MVPSLEPNSKIKSFITQAEKENFPYTKVYWYLKAAKLQCKLSRIEDAKKTMEVASSHFDSVNDGCYIKSLLKRAKVTALIDLQKVPKELVEADEYAQEAIQALEECKNQNYALFEGNFGRLRPDFVELARQFFLSNPEKANSYLNKVLTWENECAEFDYKVWMGDGGKADLKLAKFYQMSNQHEKCLDVIKKMEGYLYKFLIDEKKTCLLLDSAKIIFPVDKVYGKKLLSSAQEIIKNSFHKGVILLSQNEKLEELQEMYS